MEFCAALMHRLPTIGAWDLLYTHPIQFNLSNRLTEGITPVLRIS
jgi:hypothetical protein